MSFYRSTRRRVQHDPGTISMTSQSHKDECDINNILSLYKKTGILSHISKHTAEYMNLPDSFDYQDSINTVLRAQDAFATLPSKVRDHFQHDPALFLAAFGDPAQHAQLREWGLLKPAPAPEPLSSSSGEAANA